MKSIKIQRDKIFAEYRRKRNRELHARKRRQFLKEVEARETELENYLTLSDCVSGDIEHKRLTTMAKILREARASKNNPKAIFSMVQKLNNYLMDENAASKGKLARFVRTGLLIDYTEILEEELLTGPSAQIWRNEASLATLKAEDQDRYHLVMYITWSVLNVTSGDEKQIDAVFEAGYYRVLLQCLDIRHSFVLGNLIMSLGNALGNNAKRYRDSLKGLGFLDKFKQLFDERKDLLADKGLKRDIAWAFSNYCDGLDEVEEGVSFFSNFIRF